MVLGATKTWSLAVVLTPRVTVMPQLGRLEGVAGVLAEAFALAAHAVYFVGREEQFVLLTAQALLD